MNDENDIIKETTKQLPVREIYNDLLHPAMNEAGKGLQGVIRIALTPITALVWSYDKIATYLDEEIPKYFTKKKIDEQKIITPDPAIAVPAINAMQYTSHKEEIRSIFKNLLCSSMNTDTANSLHPAFVEIAKQLNVLDSKILEELSKKRQVICAYVTIKHINSGDFFFDGMPDIFAPHFYGLADPFILSISLQNLERLSLIKVFDGGLEKTDYDFIKTHPYVIERLNRFKMLSNNDALEINMQKKYLRITNFGIDFSEVAFDATNIRKILDNPIVTSLV
jgi:hypothetical protein